MKLLKDSIRKTLKSALNVSYRIAVKQLDGETMNKRIFIEVIEQLKEIENRKEFLAEEIGIDTTLYEDRFFIVIENLFQLAFNKEQLALIQMYLYQLVPDKEWNGTITIEDGKNQKVVPFKSPVDVWEVIKKLEK